MIRGAAPERRYAILAEGMFADSSAKTAHGLIRYGKDEVVCVMDSMLAGEHVAGVLPDLGREASGRVDGDPAGCGGSWARDRQRPPSTPRARFSRQAHLGRARAARGHPALLGGGLRGQA